MTPLMTLGQRYTLPLQTNHRKDIMKPTLTEKIILSVSGLTAVAVGTAILTIPMAFYATSGIELGGDASLLNEIRAPGGALLIMGLFILAGLIRASLTGVSLWIGAAIFMSYGMSRGLSIALDGLPDSGLVMAAAFEIAIGTLCLLGVLRRNRAEARDDRRAPQLLHSA